jgi:hypothetical protein
MTVPLSFQCKTCREYFEWTEEFRRPTTGASICSKCLAAWNAKQSSKKAYRQLINKKIRDRAQEKKRISWEKAQARRAEEKAAKKTK